MKAQDCKRKAKKGQFVVLLMYQTSKKQIIKRSFSSLLFFASLKVRYKDIAKNSFFLLV